MATFRSSRAAVLELAAQYKSLVTELEKEHTLKSAQTEEEMAKAEEAVFADMCEICLWGNATDLSLLTNLSHDDLQKLQGSQARKASQDKILANDLSKAFKVLYAAQKSGKAERRVDFILDNAGFELFVDLILAGYLLSVGLATTVVLHPKTMPWFVSDVVPKDFSDLLSALADPRSFYETPSDEDKESGKTPPPLSEKEQEELKFLFDRWAHFHAEGKLVIRPNTFWTEGGSFWRLPGTAKELHEDLKESELCIFKGDLNYRKLTGDVWRPLVVYFAFIDANDGNRQCGIRRLHSAKRWATLVLAQVCVSLRYARARVTSWSDYRRARTRSCEPWKPDQDLTIDGRKVSKTADSTLGNGPGAANGPLSNSTRESRRSIYDCVIDYRPRP